MSFPLTLQYGGCLLNQTDRFPHLFRLATIHVSRHNITMHLAVSKSLANLHEEDLVFIIRPLENIVPEHERVSLDRVSVNLAWLPINDYLPSKSFSRVCCTKRPISANFGSFGQPPIGIFILQSETVFCRRTLNLPCSLRPWHPKETSFFDALLL